MRNILLIFGILAVLSLVIGGCSSSTDPADIDADLEDFGAYKATDEDPYFGDPDVEEVASAEEEEEYNDPVALSPIVDSVECAERPDIFCLRMVWGNLERDSGVTELTDWSGKLTINRGAIVVTHLIRFEPGQDYLLPRYNEEGYYVPEELRWVSQTSCHYDGIASKLFIPPSVTDEVVTVTYESEQLTISFTMGELEELDTLITIGFGNAISFQAARFDPTSKLHGSLAGRWFRNENGQGVFYGKWISAAGRIMGTIKGQWGIDENGRQVFVGKWIDVTGKFQGFVKGFYSSHPTLSNLAYGGRFWGRIYNADSEPIGLLKGHYRRGNCYKGGYFAGRWRIGYRIPVISANETF